LTNVLVSLPALSLHQHSFLLVANGIRASFLNGLLMPVATRKPFHHAPLPTLGIHLLPTTLPPTAMSQRPSGTDLHLSSLSSITSPSTSSPALVKSGPQVEAIHPIQPAAPLEPEDLEDMDMEDHLPVALAAVPVLLPSSLLHPMGRLVSLKISFSNSLTPTLPRQLLSLASTWSAVL